MRCRASLAPDQELLLAGILEECLEAMRKGATDLDALANRYPWARQEIRPLLEIARALQRRRRRPEPPPLELVLRAREHYVSGDEASSGRSDNA